MPPSSVRINIAVSGMAVWRKWLLFSWPSNDGRKLAHFRPVGAPFGEDQRGDLVDERDFDFAQLAGRFRRHLAGAAEHPVHQASNRAAAE